jgi:uncharacterized protein
MTNLAVTLATAGVPLPSRKARNGIPAFAGMTKKVGLLIASILLVFAAPAFAQTFPSLTGRVVDQADLLTPPQETELTAKLAALEAQSGRQFVIATVNRLDGLPIQDYSYQLGRHWKIGDAQRDDGVVLVVAPKERKVWISTGYGARVVLTDAVTSVIIRNSILPKFKTGDMAGGIIDGASQVITMLTLPEAEAKRRAAEIGASEASRARGEGQRVGIFPVVFWGMIILFVIMSMARRASGGRRYRRGAGDNLGIVLWGLSEIARSSSRGGWGGGGWGAGGGFGGGGGGFSGGGGSFGGGGAGGSW